MLQSIETGSAEAFFLPVFSLYLIFIVFLTTLSVYYLVKTLRGEDFILPDPELYRKAGEAVGKSFRDRGLTIHDLIWALEVRGALKVDSQSSKLCAMKPLRTEPEHLRDYFSAFLSASKVNGDVTLKNESLIISINNFD